MSDDLRLMMVGDLVLEEPGADGFFDDSRAVLKQADVLVGHVETPHTHRGRESVGDIPAPASPPENLDALGRSGFHVATLAGNHMHDRGAEGIEDTIALLKAQNIATAGAGPTIAQARLPGLAQARGRRVAVLSYNCVGPAQGWAASNRAGVAYVRVLTHYELEIANPGGPATVYTFADPDSLEAMQADVERARADADVLVVAFHKGLVHTPAKLAMYERPVAKAAIEAGADIVIGHHAHILRGMEIYRGRPIFHGLGNFVTVTRALNVEGNDNPVRQAWAKKRKELFGFEPLPDYPLYPFHPDSRNALIADCRIAADGSISPGFLPCWIQPSGAPEVLGRGERGQGVMDYVVQITRDAGLKCDFAWDGDRVVFG